MNEPKQITVPALTLWRPWADWMILGWKTIETRTHRRLRRLGNEPTLLAIHAAQKWDENAIDAARNWISHAQIMVTERLLQDRKVGGHVLGTVTVTGFSELTRQHEPRALIECRSTTRYGPFLTDPTALIPPFPTRGRQGLFSIQLPLR